MFGDGGKVPCVGYVWVVLVSRDSLMKLSAPAQTSSGVTRFCAAGSLYLSLEILSGAFVL